MKSHIASNIFNIFNDFKFNDVDLQILEINIGDVWFRAKDCALEYKATVDSIRKDVKDKYKRIFEYLFKNEYTSSGLSVPEDILDKKSLSFK